MSIKLLKSSDWRNVRFCWQIARWASITCSLSQTKNRISRDDATDIRVTTRHATTAGTQKKLREVVIIIIIIIIITTIYKAPYVLRAKTVLYAKYCLIRCHRHGELDAQK